LAPVAGRLVAMRLRTEVPELDVGESYSAWISLEQSAAPSRRIYWQTRERFTPIWPGPPKQPSERVPVETGPAPAEPSPARGPTKRCS
jgi:hypothetical protein